MSDEYLEIFKGNIGNEYDLHKLIEILENIRKNGSDRLNMPKAIYCLEKEIETINSRLNSLES
jgi:hypothetical protein